MEENKEESKVLFTYNKDVLNIVVLILLVANLFLMAYFFFFQYSPEANLCLDDPLVYGYNELQDVNEYPISCSCSIATPNGNAPRLFFNSEGREFEEITRIGTSTNVPSLTEEEIEQMFKNN